MSLCHFAAYCNHTLTQPQIVHGVSRNNVISAASDATHTMVPIVHPQPNNGGVDQSSYVVEHRSVNAISSASGPNSVGAVSTEAPSTSVETTSEISESMFPDVLQPSGDEHASPPNVIRPPSNAGRSTATTSKKRCRTIDVVVTGLLATVLGLRQTFS